MVYEGKRECGKVIRCFAKVCMANYQPPGVLLRLNFVGFLEHLIWFPFEVITGYELITDTVLLSFYAVMESALSV